MYELDSAISTLFLVKCLLLHFRSLLSEFNLDLSSSKYVRMYNGFEF